MKNWQGLKTDPKLKQNLFIREQVIDAIRKHFKSQGFHEVETPLLVKSPGTEPYLEVFETTLKITNQPDQPAYLLTSPEYALKKLLVAGMGSIFEITKSFRNGEGVSRAHNSEFTILEWYRTPGDYTHIMVDFEELMKSIYLSLWPKKTEWLLPYQGQTYNLSAPWERISVGEAFRRYAQVGISDLLNDVALPEIARRKKLVKNSQTTWEEAFHVILLNEVEPNLGKVGPTILYDYPASQAALSKKKTSDPRFSERFEVFLAGLELGNAFSELADPWEQEERFLAELKLREGLGKTKFELDQDFIEALRVGLPEAGGIAVGVDRLVMLFADETDIGRVISFPQRDLFDIN